MRRSYATTGTSRAAAWSSALVSVVPSIAAITSASTPRTSMFSTWLSWVGISSSAYCRMAS